MANMTLQTDEHVRVLRSEAQEFWHPTPCHARTPAARARSQLNAVVLAGQIPARRRYDPTNGS